jgi:hypothetical protein
MANRYWVGGTAAWDGTAGSKWALTSGGAGGQAIPTSADDVFFDAASGAVTCTISTTIANAKSLNCTGFTGTLAGTVQLNLSGSITLSAGMTFSYTGDLVIIDTGTIISAGKTFNGNINGCIVVSGAGITVTLGDALTLSSAGALFNLFAGSLDLNGFTLTTGQFSSNNSAARSIAFGAKNIVLTDTQVNFTCLQCAAATNFTWTGTGGFVRNMVSATFVSFGSSGGGSTTNAPNLSITGGASTLTITNNSWFKNLVFTGSTSTVSNASPVNIAGNLTLATGGTYTAVNPAFRGSGTITSNSRSLSAFGINGSGITVVCADALAITGALTFTLGTLQLKDGATSTVGSFVTSGTTLKYLQSTTAGVQATISDSSGTNSVTYLDIKDSNATGGATWDASSPTNVNSGSNSGWLGLGGGNMFLLFI